MFAFLSLDTIQFNPDTENCSVHKALQELKEEVCQSATVTIIMHAMFFFQFHYRQFLKWLIKETQVHHHHQCVITDVL